MAAGTAETMDTRVCAGEASPPQVDWICLSFLYIICAIMASRSTMYCLPLFMFPAASLAALAPAGLQISKMNLDNCWTFGSAVVQRETRRSAAQERGNEAIQIEVNGTLPFM